MEREFGEKRRLLKMERLKIVSESEETKTCIRRKLYS
jgi:hypothetical protein